jgi:hypothetical protein
MNFAGTTNKKRAGQELRFDLKRTSVEINKDCEEFDVEVF